MLVKVHKTPDYRIILAICDKELLGKKFVDEKNERQIDLSGSFYAGKEVDEATLNRLLQGAYIVNFVGEKTLKMLKEKRLATDSDIILIKKIPHGQLLIVTDDSNH